VTLCRSHTALDGVTGDAASTGPALIDRAGADRRTACFGANAADETGRRINADKAWM